MKQLTVLNKIIIITILACLMTACSVEKNMESHKNDKEESEGGYAISFRDIPMRHDKLKWKNNISYRKVELSCMSDTSLEGVINESIEEAMTSWIGGKVFNATEAHLEIYCHSSRYLSFVNLLLYEGRRQVYIPDYITIDLKTGKRVMLDDLMRIDEEFVRYIQKNDLSKTAINDFVGGVWEILKNYTVDELLAELKECSMTQQQVTEEEDCPVEESIESLVNRNSFYLRNNQLVIVISYAGSERHFTFDIDDISDFLKVEVK